MDNPDERYNLDFKQIWDSNSEDQTFLFSAETEGKEEIYEYDFTEKTSLDLDYWEEVYGWLTSQTLLMKTESMTEIYEVNIYTGEKVKAAGDKVLGIILF